MRIKFRAWAKEHGLMYDEWDAKGVSPAMRGGGGGVELGFALLSPHAYEVMQYTGINDKNGVEIYEGDIVRFQPIAVEPQIYEVRWGHFGFTYYDPKEPEVKNRYVQQSYVEVIGNIYEDKELLV